MKGRHFAKKDIKKAKRNRSIILSVVAVLELLLLITSMTFSWFEGLTSLEMIGENIKSAAEINSHAILGENKTGSDTTFSNIIDLTKFFDAQRDVRLSPVSSADGKNFFAVYEGTAGASNAKYRKLYPEDVNANIIQFEFNISSADGPTDVYLSEIIPRVFINGNEYSNEYTYPYRFAFSDGETNHVLSTNDILDTEDNRCYLNQQAVYSLNADNTANIKTGVVERTRQFSYYADHRTHINGPDAGGETTNGTKLEPLFTLSKDEVKTITVSIWIEALDYECLYKTQYNPKPGNDISFGLKMCTSWSIYRKITVYDYTADQSIKDKYSDGNTATALYVRNIDGNSDASKRALYKLTYNASTKTWTGNIPIGLKNCEFLWRPTSDPTSSTYNDYPTWQAANRGNETELTLLGKTACVWNLPPAKLTKIEFRDYTNDNWVINKDDQGKDIKMYSRIVYDGKILECDMSETPTTDSNKKNTWTCWIPATVQDVNFLRKGLRTSSSTDVILNYWTADSRGEEYIYRATNDGELGVDNTYVLYLKVNSSLGSKFYVGGAEPSISQTNNNNKNYINSVASKAGIDRSRYFPALDTWPLGDKPLTKVSDHLYYIAFATKPTAGTTFTAWNRSFINDANEVPINTGFGLQDVNPSVGNTIYIGSVTEITSANAKNNYYYTTSFISTTETVNTFPTTDPDARKTGVWGELEMPTYPEGTYTTYFVPMKATSSVSVFYYYNNIAYTVEMEQGSDGIWFTNYVPDGLKYMTFTDSSGMSWETDPDSESFSRSSTSNYYYPYKPTSSGNTKGSGNFCHKLSGNAINLKHFDTAITNIYVRFTTSVTVDGTATSTYMYLPLTKGSDNLTWSTSYLPSSITTMRFYDAGNTSRYWNSNTGRSTSAVSTAYVVNKNTNSRAVQWKTGTNHDKWIRIYFTDNSSSTGASWSSRYIYYWDGFQGNSWPGYSMSTYIGTNDMSQRVYYALVPSGSKIIFNNNGNYQTSDITSNVTDMKGFYLTGSPNKSMGHGTWDVTATWLYSYSLNVALPTS